MVTRERKSTQTMARTIGHAADHASSWAFALGVLVILSLTAVAILCAPGESHAIRNAGDEDLVIYASIMCYDA